MLSKAVICALLAVAAAAPQGYRVPTPAPTYGGGPVVPILVDDRQGPDQFGNYNFNFETGDGISRQEQGRPQGELGAVASQGGWSFTFPDGSPAVFSFVADGAGYQPQSDLLPTPHPLPAHAIAQIEKARQEDALGANRPPPPRQELWPSIRRFT
nr:cuticle protein AMP1B-like [Penaeus vannamei]